MCDLNSLCTNWEHDISNNICRTFTEKKAVTGDGAFAYNCYLKEDPPSLRFSKQPGECVRVDGTSLNQKTNRNTVNDAS